ncbi:neuromedin-K receptor-like [Oculina patagonica]
MILPFSVATVSVLTAAYIVIFPVALSANILLIFIILKRPTMRTTINYLFANMAASNLLVAVFIMPYAVRYLFAADAWFGGVAGQISCRIVNFAYAISIASSVLSLTAISLDQFYAILFPMKRIAVIRNTRFTTMVIWISSVIFMSPYLAMFGIREIAGQYQCVYMVLDRIIMEIHFTFMFVFLYAFPLVLMGALYVLIGRKLWFRTIPGNIHSIHRQAAELSKRRVIRMLIIVIATFALCWFPVHVFDMCAAFEPRLTRNMASYWSLLIVFIAHANSALNPCLEIALNRKFRGEFFKISATCRNFLMWCFRKRNERRRCRDSQINMHRFESVENMIERIAKRRGRLYDMSAQMQTLNSCPISLVQFSYHNSEMEIES